MSGIPRASTPAQRARARALYWLNSIDGNSARFLNEHPRPAPPRECCLYCVFCTSDLIGPPQAGQAYSYYCAVGSAHRPLGREHHAPLLSYVCRDFRWIPSMARVMS